MSRNALFTVFTVTALTAAGCATAPDTVSRAPDFSPIPTRSEPRTRLYADCIAQAATAGTYGYGQDADTDLILFTCTGAPAQAFYDGLAERSAAVESQVVTGGRTYRSTNPVIRDLFGVDYCSTGGPDDYACVITLNAGEFLRN